MVSLVPALPWPSSKPRTDEAAELIESRRLLEEGRAGAAAARLRALPSPEARSLLARALVQPARYPGASALREAWDAAGAASRARFQPDDTFALRKEIVAAFFRHGHPREGLARLEELFRESGDAELGRDLERQRAALQRLDRARALAVTGHPAARELCGELIDAGSTLAPIARLIRGTADHALEDWEAGMGSLEGAHALEEAGVSIDWIYGRLRDGWERETAPDRLGRYGAVLSAMARLYPEDPRYLLDGGRVGLRAGRAAEAASCFTAALEGGRLPPAARVPALEGAADAFFAAGSFTRAAAGYREIYSATGERDARALFRHAESLMRAGIYEPGALDAFEEYVRRVRPGDGSLEIVFHGATALAAASWLRPSIHAALLARALGSRGGVGRAAPLLPQALLNRARIFEALGRPEKAAVEFARVMRERSLGIDPRTPEWAEALLGRARALLASARASSPEASLRPVAQARESLEEYLERYGADEPPRPGSIEACYLLVRAAVAGREWGHGLEALRRLDEVARRISPEAQAPFGDMIREARFLEGDLHFNQGDYAAAERCYGEAYRRYAASEERLWGLIGRARARLRLGRKDEAGRDTEIARALYQDHREALDRATGGSKYWRSALEALEKEVR
jgi:tetratricopeptide (TPR) repeat protein